MQFQSKWTEEEDQELARLWAQDAPQLSTAQIAIVMGKNTKNQIVGRVRRLGLPSRPSPIKGPRKATLPPPLSEKPAQERVRRRSLPANPQNEWQDWLGTAAGHEAMGRPEASPSPRPKPKPTTVEARAVLACLPAGTTRLTPDRGCQWIDGDPKRPGWSFCNAKREGFASYCAAHLRRVWKQPTEEDQAEAA